MRKERLYKKKPSAISVLVIQDRWIPCQWKLEFRNAIVSGVYSGLNEQKITDSTTQKFAGFRNSDDQTWNEEHWSGPSHFPEKSQTKQIKTKKNA